MKKSKFNNNKNNKKLNNKSIWILTCIIFIFLLALVISTKYVGLTDVDDYANVAKFFSGDYPAKIRSSHSFFYGFLLSPLVSLSNSFIHFPDVFSFFRKTLFIIFQKYFCEWVRKKIVW